MNINNQLENELPLSAAQRGIWFAQKLGSPDSIFNLAESIEIHGPIDPTLFETALRQAAIESIFIPGKHPPGGGCMSEVLSMEQDPGICAGDAGYPASLRRRLQ